MSPRGLVHTKNSTRVLLDDSEDNADDAHAPHQVYGANTVPTARQSIEGDASVGSPKSPVAVPLTTTATALCPVCADAVCISVPSLTHQLTRERHRSIRVGLLCAFVTTGYAFAMFVNGMASHLSPSTARIDTTALQPFIRTLYLQLDGLFALSLYRCCAAACLVALIACTGDKPATPTPLDGRLVWPFLMGITNAGGYLFYMILVSYGGVALWSSLVGCYVVLPVLYGLCFRRESRAPRKLLGIAACITAVTMLSLAESIGESTGDGSDATKVGIDAVAAPELHPAVAAVLFGACVLTWAACDTLASYIARPPKALHVTAVVAGAGAGFGALALVCAAVARGIEAGAPGPPSDAPPPAPAHTWWAGQAALAAAQAIGVLAQYGTVLLGRHGADASSFLPLTSTYTALVALLGVAFLGERMPGIGYAGITVSAAGVLLIASAG